ncbi:MAG: phosphoadenosine phosphosulfate reductase family protein [Fusobacteriaceae bacterium]
MTGIELQMLQALPLDIKIMKTEARISEFVEHFGLDGVYVSYSGGKDSEVLVDIVRRLYPEVKIVFINTGVELPGIYKQVAMRKRSGWNIEYVLPKKRFVDIVKDFGFPVVSKEQAGYIYEHNNTKSEELKKLRLEGKNGSWKISEKWKFLLDADFKISGKCCYYLKKEPANRYERKTKRRPITGMMAQESSIRKVAYLKSGCNAFDAKRQISAPLGFWLEKDIWDYINQYELEISEEYTVNGRLRTGCAYCLFGANQEECKTGTNNIMRLKKDYPLLYKFVIEKLGYNKIMTTLNLKWK